MEAERRSTMSSLKGQLSNVEGSVKSMKVAVVVGSVLTVACLAAVFGVTVLANEVSKEVKVSNGALTSKSGSAVLTTTQFATDRLSLATENVVVKADEATYNLKVQSAVSKAGATTFVVDGAVVTVADGSTSFSIQENSLLASVVSSEADRKLNWVGWVVKIVTVIAGIEGEGILTELKNCANRAAGTVINAMGGSNALPACGNAPASGYYTPIE